MTPLPENNHEEQQGYARLLDVSAKLGLAVLVLCFCAYVFDLLPGKMALAQLAQHWHLPLNTYLAATGAPTGWGWVSLLAYGDFSCIFGIALLAGCSIPCLAFIMRIYARRGDRAYVVICLLRCCSWRLPDGCLRHIEISFWRVAALLSTHGDYRMR